MRVGLGPGDREQNLSVGRRRKWRDDVAIGGRGREDGRRALASLLDVLRVAGHHEQQGPQYARGKCRRCWGRHEVSPGARGQPQYLLELVLGSRGTPIVAAPYPHTPCTYTPQSP